MTKRQHNIDAVVSEFRCQSCFEFKSINDSVVIHSNDDLVKPGMTGKRVCLDCWNKYRWE